MEERHATIKQKMLCMSFLMEFVPGTEISVLNPYTSLFLYLFGFEKPLFQSLVFKATFLVC